MTFTNRAHTTIELWYRIIVATVYFTHYILGNSVCQPIERSCPHCIGIFFKQHTGTVIDAGEGNVFLYGIGAIAVSIPASNPKYPFMRDKRTPCSIIQKPERVFCSLTMNCFLRYRVIMVHTGQHCPDPYTTRDILCNETYMICLLYTSPSPRDRQKSRMPSSACKK